MAEQDFVALGRAIDRVGFDENGAFVGGHGELFVDETTAELNKFDGFAPANHAAGLHFPEQENLLHQAGHLLGGVADVLKMTGALFWGEAFEVAFENVGGRHHDTQRCPELVGNQADEVRFHLDDLPLAVEGLAQGFLGLLTLLRLDGERHEVGEAAGGGDLIFAPPAQGPDLFVADDPVELAGAMHGDIEHGHDVEGPEIRVPEFPQPQVCHDIMGDDDAGGSFQGREIPGIIDRAESGQVGGVAVLGAEVILDFLLDRGAVGFHAGIADAFDLEAGRDVREQIL